METTDKQLMSREEIAHLKSSTSNYVYRLLCDTALADLPDTSKAMEKTE